MELKISKKELLARVINLFLPDFFFRVFSKLSGSNGKLTVLAYHRILDFNDNFPFDIDLISATPKQFEDQLKHVSKFYNPIDIESVVECYKSNKKLPKNSVLVTFDDGFLDNYSNAFPLLKKYNVPATIFISTDYIGSDSTLWFDQLAFLILSDDLNVSEDNPLFNFINQDSAVSKRKILETCLEELKLVSNKERLNILDNLAKSNEVLIRKMPCKEFSSTLNWNQVNEMNDSLISFGSHTASHPILTRLNDDEKLLEMTSSKTVIEENLKQTIDTVAYPVGTDSAYDESVVKSTQSAGYELGFTYVSGVNDWPLDQPYKIKRLHVEQYTSTPLFKCMLSMPRIFGY
jgi:peptidoglycan/xylan/chitin deacetylase (PgdA/CDA1 family)